MININIRCCPRKKYLLSDDDDGNWLAAPDVVKNSGLISGHSGPSVIKTAQVQGRQIVSWSLVKMQLIFIRHTYYQLVSQPGLVGI